MARYRIKYNTGEEGAIEAATVEYDPEGRQYIFRDGDQLVAFLPGVEIRSIIAQDARC